jgi:hypothetical protein
VIEKGLSVIVIERGEGVETSAIKTSYSPAAGTTLKCPWRIFLERRTKAFT